MSYKITVRSILNLPALAGSRVLGGEQGLDREVRTVKVGETKFSPEWLRGGDFVCGAIPFLGEVKDQAEREALLCRWARALNNAGASCLAIKTRLYLEEIPASLSELGDLLNFPIIELPADIAQQVVLESVMGLVIARHEQGTRLATHAFMELCQLMVGPHDLNLIADKLAGFVGNPILIENDGFALLACSDSTSPAVAEVLKIRRSQPVLSALSKRLAARPGELAVLGFSCSGRYLTQMTWPVKAKDQILGYVSVVEMENILTEDNQELLMTCLGAVALDMSQQFYMESALWRIRSEFLELLLAPQLDEQAAQHMADMLGIDCGEEKIAMVVGVQTKGMTNAVPQDYYYDYFVRFAVQGVNEYLSELRTGALVCAHRGSVVIIIDTVRRNADALKKQALWLRESLLQKQPGAEISIGIGRSGRGLRAIRESCLEAVDAVECIRRFRCDEPVMRYDELGQYTLLVSVIRNEGLARGYSGSILGRIIDRDKQEGTNLLETLGVYLDTNCSYAETSRIMFLHPKTIKYRIGQIETLLPVGLTSFSDRSAVGLALDLYRSLEGGEK